MKKIQAYLDSYCSNLGSGRTDIIPPLDAEVCGGCISHQGKKNIFTNET